jgi:hypothetical protein
MLARRITPWLGHELPVHASRWGWHQENSAEKSGVWWEGGGMSKKKRSFTPGVNGRKPLVCKQ